MYHSLSNANTYLSVLLNQCNYICLLPSLPNLFPTISFRMELPTVKWCITLKFSLWFHSKPHQLIFDCSEASNNPLAQSQCKLFKQSNWKKKINSLICLKLLFHSYAPEKFLQKILYYNFSNYWVILVCKLALVATLIIR